MVRKEIFELKDIGRMPNEHIDDDSDIDILINKYSEILDKIKPPITLEEGNILINLFPPHAFYDLQWDLLQLIESLYKKIDITDYKELIEKCPSEEWKSGLKKRLENVENNMK
jgi:hypothetical protein